MFERTLSSFTLWAEGVLWGNLDEGRGLHAEPDVRAAGGGNPFVDPTQHFMKNSFGLPRSEESIRAQAEFKFYPKAVQEQWLNFYKKNRFINEVSYEKRARWIELRNKIIKAIYEAGGATLGEAAARAWLAANEGADGVPT